MRFSFAGAFALIVALLLPAAAGAAVRKVAPSGTDTGNCIAAVCKTVQYAADQGEANDTIEIGAGTYVETVEATAPLEFVGAGSGATTVQGPDGFEAAGDPAFVLPDGGSISSLRAEGGGGDSVGPVILTGYPGGNAIDFQPAGLGAEELDLEAVVAVGGAGGAGTFPNGGSGGNGLLAAASEGGKTVSVVDSSLAAGASGGIFGNEAVIVSGASISAKFVDSELESPGAFAGAFRVANGATATIETSSLEGFRGASAEAATLTIRRSLIDVDLSGVFVNPLTSPKAEATVIDSVVVSGGVGGAAVGGVGSGVSKLVGRGSTFVARAGVGPGGPAIESQASTNEQPVTVTLHNSIAIHESGSAPQRDLVANGGTIDAEYSNFTTSTQENGGTAPAPGSGTNVGGPPGFDGPDTLDLSPASPLIDRGDPEIVEPGELDFAGNARAPDGNRDCIAAPDIGALEVVGQSAPCPPAKVGDAVPVVSGFAITNRKFAPRGGGRPAKASAKRPKKGTKFTYDLSEPAQVAIRIERRKKRKGKVRFVKVTSIGGQQPAGKGSTPFSGKVRGKPLKPGRYRATIVATDSAGQASTPHQLAFKIVNG